MRPHTFAPWMPAALTVGAALMMTLEAMCVRLLGDTATQAQILLFRAGTQLVLIVALAPWLVGGMGPLLHTERLRSHLLRGVLASVSWWCYFMSFKVLPLALATTMTFSGQLFVLLLAWPLLRERVTRAQAVSTLVGFVGVLIAARVFSPTDWDWHIAYALASALLGAVMVLITRSLSFTDRTETILFYMALCVFVSAIPQCLLYWEPLVLHNTVLLLGMSFSGTFGAWMMVVAYKHAQPSAVAPFTYVRLVFAAAVGVWVFGDTILPTTLIGALLIVASNLVMAFVASRRL
jgi:drug/metabolite transporter (DMT)-like permease